MVSVKSPFVAVVRYGEIGSRMLQRQVVLPASVTLETSTPLASAVLPSGTVIAKSNVALSFGLSLTGNQPGEPCGSFTTNAPSAVLTQPSNDSSGSMTVCGTPLYSTSTVKSWRGGSGGGGGVDG